MILLYADEHERSTLARQLQYTHISEEVLNW